MRLFKKKKIVRTKRPTKCWVCLRIPASQVLRWAHLLWTDRVVAREIGLTAAQYIEYAYKNKPWFFCGRPAKSTVGSLLYMLGVFKGERVTQRDFGEKLDVSEVGIRTNYKRWLRHFTFSITL